MNNNKIGVFDSGIGGLTTLEEIKKLLPNEEYIYIADSKNNPYGEKSSEELLKIVKNNVDNLLKENVKLIVIACNTATTKCIKILREQYPNTLFIGTEPAIKVACDNNYKNTILMATPGTIKSERTHELIKNNIKNDQNIYLLPCENLANAIETNNKEKISELLNKYLKEYQNKNIDSIVLGCTHYPHIKNEIQKLFPNSNIIDGNKGVAKRVKFILEENCLLNTSNKKGNTIIITNK